MKWTILTAEKNGWECCCCCELVALDLDKGGGGCEGEKGGLEGVGRCIWIVLWWRWLLFCRVVGGRREEEKCGSAICATTVVFIIIISIVVVKLWTL